MNIFAMAACSVCFFADVARAQACTLHTAKFIVQTGDAELATLEDDIRADLAAIGITVNTAMLSKADFNTAMTAGDFNLSAAHPPPL